MAGKRVGFRTDFRRIVRRNWAIIWLSLKRFNNIDGFQQAGAFSFFAFFSLFPLTIVVLTLLSAFIEKAKAAHVVVGYLQSYFPIGEEMRSSIVQAVSSALEARGSTGILAFLLLVWVAGQGFTTIIIATNQAWSARTYSWWRLPMRSLFLLGMSLIVILLGLILPIGARKVTDWLIPAIDHFSLFYILVTFLIPLVVIFLSLIIFYRLAPTRKTRFSEAWVSALVVVAMILLGDNVFDFYLRHYFTANALHGAFSAIIAILLWFYYFGMVFIFGACLCAARAEITAGNS